MSCILPDLVEASVLLKLEEHNCSHMVLYIGLRGRTDLISYDIS